MKTIPYPNGVDGTLYIAEDGKVIVSRHITSSPFGTTANVESAVRTVIQDAKKLGQPTDNLMLNRDRFEDILGLPRTSDRARQSMGGIRRGL